MQTQLWYDTLLLGAPQDRRQITLLVLYCYIYTEEYILLVDLLPPLALSNEREGGIRGVAEIYTPLINAIRP